MILKLPLQIEVETKAVLKKVAVANKFLAEFKGVMTSIPNLRIQVRRFNPIHIRLISSTEKVSRIGCKRYRHNTAQ